MVEHAFQPAFGSPLLLERGPAGVPDNLRAWDAADEYLLKNIAETGLPSDGSPVLVVNDAFGALAVALAQAGLPVLSWNDSLTSHRALARNLELNSLPGGAVDILPGDRPPPRGMTLVLIKFPKTLAWLEDSLLQLRPCLEQGSRIVAGGMIKHTPKRAFTLLETCLGPTTTSLGWKKARLAFTGFDPDRDLPPALPEAEIQLPDLGLVLRSRSGVFSRDRLDPGTGFLLQYLPRPTAPVQVLDLGCGSGALALALGRLCPGAEIMGTDDSYQAVASARANAAAAGLPANFQVMDCAAELSDSSCDLVLCNPPFHQERTVGDQTARAMFLAAYRVLRRGGELRVVGNRHLGYHARLTEVFGGCALVAQNDKFVVLSAARG